MPTMSVRFLYDHDGEQVWGAPAAKAGETVEVPFGIGARLVAAEWAEEEEAEGAVEPEAEEE